MRDNGRIFLKLSSAEAPQAATAARTWTFILTTGSPDLEGDRIAIDGVDLEAFLKNPVCLVAHAQDSLPVGKWTNVRRIGAGFAGRIEADLVLPPAGEVSAADEVASLIASGILKAASIGFLSLEREANEFGGYDHLRVRLLEASVVAVGMNPEALRRSLAELRTRQAGRLKAARSAARGVGRRLWKVRHDERQRVLTPAEVRAGIERHARAAMRKQLYALTGNLDLAEPEPALGSSGARLPVTQREAAQLIARGVAQAVGDLVRAKSAQQS